MCTFFMKLLRTEPQPVHQTYGFVSDKGEMQRGSEYTLLFTDSHIVGSNSLPKLRGRMLFILAKETSKWIVK